MKILFIVLAIIVLYFLISIWALKKPRRLLKLGITKYNDGNYEDALQQLNASIKINPLNANPYLYRAYCKTNLGDYRGAIDDYTEVMKRKNPTADDYLNRGSMKHNIEDYEGAIADFTQATYVNEQDSDAYYNRGLSYSKQGYVKAATLDWNIAAGFGNEKAINSLQRLENEKDNNG